MVSAEKGVQFIPEDEDKKIEELLPAREDRWYLPENGWYSSPMLT